MVRFDLGLLLQGQMSIAKLESAYNSLIIDPRGLQIMGWETSDVVRFDLGPLLQGQMRIEKLKSAYNLLIIAPRVLGYQTNLKEIIYLESPDVVKFDLGRPPSRLYKGSQIKKCL